MTATPVAAVLLDFYGTLAEAVEWGRPLADVLRRHGAVATTDATTLSGLDPLDGVLHTEHSADRAAYVAWERLRLAAVAERYGIPAGAMADVVDEMHAAIKEYVLEVYDDVFPALESLRARGLRLAVCSNWDWDLPELLQSLGLGGAFDVVVTSARAGARKAHPHIYEHTLELLSVPPDAVAFVGDTFEPDVAGPARHGMQPFHLVRTPVGGHMGGPRTPSRPPLPPGAHRIASLTEITDLL